MAGVYVLSATYRTNSTTIELRANYFGLCARKPETEWQCASRKSNIEDEITSDEDPEDLLGLAESIKSEILFPGIQWVHF